MTSAIECYYEAVRSGQGYCYYLPRSTETRSGTRRKMFRRLIATSATWFTLPIRLGLAAVMIAHGAQKVLGSFGGSGFKTFIGGNTPFGFMRPTWLWLAAAALSELRWWSARWSRIFDSCGSVLHCVHDADGSGGSALAGRLLCCKPRIRISTGAARNGRRAC